MLAQTLFRTPLVHLVSLGVVSCLVTGVFADWQYKSRPDLSPPQLNITIHSSSDVSPGYIFVAPYNMCVFNCREPNGPLQPAPYIFTSAGELVWSGLGYFNGLTGNFQVGRYDSHEVLFGFEANWAGRPGNTHSHITILDQNYETIKEVRSGSHYVLDSHEFKILDGKTALVQSNHPVPFDLSEYGMNSASQWILEATVQEIDLKTGKLLFEWNSLDHVSPEETVFPIASLAFGTGHNSSGPVDYLHLNSIERFDENSYLISARHTSTIYKIDKKTGKIVWRLGGNHSNFTLGEEVQFGFQHDARVISKSGDLAIMSLFDNAAPVFSARTADFDDRSSGKRVELNTKTWTAKLVQKFPAPDGLFAFSQGNNQLLPNGNAFVNWGSAGAITEFAPNGSAIFHAYLDSKELFENGDVQNYRGFKFNWTGTPREAPAIVALKHGESTMVYISWNGDTETKLWKFYGIDENGKKKFLGEEQKRDFETGFYVYGGDKWQGYVAESVNEDGKTLVHSKVAESQKYIYQYVPGRDDFVVDDKRQKVLGEEQSWAEADDLGSQSGRSFVFQSPV